MARDMNLPSRFNDRMVKLVLQGACGDLVFTAQGHIAHVGEPGTPLILIYSTGTHYPAMTNFGLEFIRENLHRDLSKADKATVNSALGSRV